MQRTGGAQSAIAQFDVFRLKRTGDMVGIRTI